MRHSLPTQLSERGSPGLLLAACPPVPHESPPHINWLTASVPRREFALKIAAFWYRRSLLPRKRIYCCLQGEIRGRAGPWQIPCCLPLNRHSTSLYQGRIVFDVRHVPCPGAFCFQPSILAKHDDLRCFLALRLIVYALMFCMTGDF